MIGGRDVVRIALHALYHGCMAEQAPGREPIRFEAAVCVVGDRRILRLPPEASAALPSRGQVAVVGLVNGHPVETVLEPDGMRGHWLALDPAATGPSAGSPAGSAGGSSAGPLTAIRAEEVVTVELVRREDWPEPQVPSAFSSALAEAPAAEDTWADITPMARWEWVRWVDATKNPETRNRRIEVSMSKLGKGMRRPCCFDLASCTDPELSKNGKLLGLS